MSQLKCRFCDFHAVRFASLAAHEATHTPSATAPACVQRAPSNRHPRTNTLTYAPHTASAASVLSSAPLISYSSVHGVVGARQAAYTALFASDSDESPPSFLPDSMCGDAEGVEAASAAGMQMDVVPPAHGIDSGSPHAVAAGVVTADSAWIAESFPTVARTSPMAETVFEDGLILHPALSELTPLEDSLQEPTSMPPTSPSSPTDAGQSASNTAGPDAAPQEHQNGCDCGGEGHCKAMRIWSCTVCSPDGPFTCTYAEAEACEDRHGHDADTDVDQSSEPPTSPTRGTGTPSLPASPVLECPPHHSISAPPPTTPQSPSSVDSVEAVAQHITLTERKTQTDDNQRISSEDVTATPGHPPSPVSLTDSGESSEDRGGDVCDRCRNPNLRTRHTCSRRKGDREMHAASTSHSDPKNAQVGDASQSLDENVATSPAVCIACKTRRHVAHTCNRRRGDQISARRPRKKSKKSVARVKATTKLHRSDARKSSLRHRKRVALATRGQMANEDSDDGERSGTIGSGMDPVSPTMSRSILPGPTPSPPQLNPHPRAPASRLRPRPALQINPPAASSSAQADHRAIAATIEGFGESDESGIDITFDVDVVDGIEIVSMDEANHDLFMSELEATATAAAASGGSTPPDSAHETDSSAADDSADESDDGSTADSADECESDESDDGSSSESDSEDGAGGRARTSRRRRVVFEEAPFAPHGEVEDIVDTYHIERHFAHFLTPTSTPHRLHPDPNTQPRGSGAVRMTLPTEVADADRSYLVWSKKNRSTYQYRWVDANPDLDEFWGEMEDIRAVQCARGMLQVATRPPQPLPPPQLPH